MNATPASVANQIQASLAGDLRKVYLAVYTAGTADVGDIVDKAGVNSRYARELLGILRDQARLILHPDETDTTVYTYNVDPFDSLADNETSAAEVIDQWLKETMPEQAPLPKTATKAKSPSSPKTKSGAVGPCGCGCGGQTPRSYLPGHDARHAGQVARSISEYVIANDMDPREIGLDSGLLEALPSPALKEKALAHAIRLVGKASTKKPEDRKAKIDKALTVPSATARRVESIIMGDDDDPALEENRLLDNPEADTVHIHEVMDQVAKELTSAEHFTYGTLAVGRNVYHARRDADGVVTRSDVKVGSEASTEVPTLAHLPYINAVADAKAKNFKAYEVQP